METSTRALRPPLAEAAARVLRAWHHYDCARGIHPADRDAVHANEAVRSLVVELLTASGGDPRDLYSACARLGRLLADAGASPSLAAATMDGAASALAHAEIPFDEAKLLPARASLAEGYFAAAHEAERRAAGSAWEYPACAVRLDAETAAIAAGYPDTEREAIAEWAARVALAASRDGVRRVVLAGGAVTELTDALSLIGVTVLPRLAPEPSGRAKRGWLRFPWRK